MAQWCRGHMLPLLRDVAPLNVDAMIKRRFARRQFIVLMLLQMFVRRWPCALGTDGSTPIFRVSASLRPAFAVGILPSIAWAVDFLIGCGFERGLACVRLHEFGVVTRSTI